MNPTDPSKHEQPAMLRRVQKAIVSEFTPPPIPRPTPNEEQLTEGHLAVGMIDDAIEDGPSEAQGADTLVITAEAPGHGTLHRTTSCPLEMPRSGHRLVGQTITFRHTTFDPDYVKDILVVRWPLEVRNALRPVRDEGPGGVRARVWASWPGAASCSCGPASCSRRSCCAASSSAATCSPISLHGSTPASRL